LSLRPMVSQARVIRLLSALPLLAES